MNDTPESRRFYSRKCAAMDVLLDNLPTVLEPHRGDPDVVEQMSAILDESYVEPGEARSV